MKGLTWNRLQFANATGRPYQTNAARRGPNPLWKSKPLWNSEDMKYVLIPTSAVKSVNALFHCLGSQPLDCENCQSLLPRVPAAFRQEKKLRQEVRPAPLQNPFVSSAVVSEFSFHRTVGFHLCCQCDPFHHIPIKLPKLTVCKLHRTHLSCVHCELDHGDNRSRAEAKRFS